MHEIYKPLTPVKQPFETTNSRALCHAQVVDQSFKTCRKYVEKTTKEIAACVRLFIPTVHLGLEVVEVTLNVTES
jgi:hypothetical protein